VIHFIVQPFHIRCVFLLGDSPKFSIHLSWRICCCGAFDQLHLERDLSVYADPERLFRATPLPLALPPYLTISFTLGSRFWLVTERYAFLVLHGLAFGQRESNGLFSFSP